ncbi:agmatine deiminase family protein [Kineococcus sp. NUM-3379]
MPVDVAGPAVPSLPPVHRRVPPEWAPHARTWLAWPTADGTFGAAGGERLAAAREAWAALACAVAHHEPVTVLARAGEGAAARAAVRCRAEVAEVAEVPPGGVWLRESGPVFVRGADGTAAAVGRAAPERDRLLARRVAELARVPLVESSLVPAAGGAVRVDGQGTALVPEAVLPDPGRDPGPARAEAEAELRRTLGVERTVWLPRGAGAGAHGPADVAAFARPGLVLAHVQPDPRHPDHEVCAETVRLLRASEDARGRRLEVVEVPAPEVDGELAGATYLGFYLVNGAVLLGGVGGVREAEVVALFRRVFPERAVDVVDARAVLAAGGGVHRAVQPQLAP